MRRHVPSAVFVPPTQDSDRERIIELFAKPQPAYVRADVVRLLGLSDEEFEHEVAGLIADPELNDRGMTVFRWEDVAHLALERWTPRMIEAALRIKARGAIPHLNQHRLIQVSLPLYLIRYLDFRARRESENRLSRNASDIIERVLHEHADGEDLHHLELEISGFVQALRYPYYTPRASNIVHRCRYCDISITEAAREVCKPCSKRHEPKEHLGEYGLPELEEPDEPHETQPPATPRDQRDRNTPTVTRKRRRRSSRKRAGRSTPRRK